MSAERPAARDDHVGPGNIEQRGPVTLREADEAASVAHDFIHGKNGVTKEQASAAIWLIHEALRPLFEEQDLGY